ncbi:MAG TPA: LPS export ABC transporter periplasmic protein LptC [Chitinophagaceae bacterium]|nr:LPS export ABC transporter periplasmic protein LptC [Chitinophagaceae bacterium]
MTFHHPYKINLGAALLIGCFFMASCENSQRELDERIKRRIGVEVGKGIKINYSIGGRTKSIVTAPLMLRYQDTVPYIEFPQSIHADFYDADLAIESRLNARYGRYMETESKVFLRDSVRLLNRNGDTLYTNKLYWDRNRIGREFYTDDSVRIRTKTHLINGVGFESSQDFNSQAVFKIYNSIVRIPSSQFPQ